MSETVILVRGVRGVSLLVQEDGRLHVRCAAGFNPHRVRIGARGVLAVRSWWVVMSPLSSDVFLTTIPVFPVPWIKPRVGDCAVCGGLRKHFGVC